MNLPRLAWSMLAAVLVPAGCFTPVPCDGPLCLSIANVSRVQVGVAPDALTIADVDGDGARDLVGASGPAGTVTVVWGGDTGFTDSATTWSIDQEVAGIVVADLDADGHLDLATALPRADAVAVVRGRGGRSFAEPERFAAGAVPRALIAAELDGQSPPELVTADLADGTVTVLHRFVAAPPLVVGPGPRALAAGDLDGDGHVNVAVALADADAVQILHGDGRGSLQPAALLPVGAAPYALVAADLDGDARLDLATADSLDDTVSVLLSAGAGEFTNRKAWPTVSLPAGLVATRPTDSLPVLGVLSPTTSTVERLDPRTGAAVVGVVATDAKSLAADGDLLVGGGGALSSLSLGTGLVLTSEWEDSDVRNVWPVDLDGDGVDELLVRSLDTESGGFWLRRGDGEQQVHVDAGDPDRVQAGDLTGDGLGDLFLRDKDTLYVAIQGPSGELGEAIVTAFDDLADAVLADIDADGVAEVVALIDAEGGGRIEVYRSDAAGALTRALATSFDLDPPPDSLSVIDGDGDAVPDLLLKRHGAFFLVEDGHGPVRALDFGEHYPDAPAFADLDRDGRLDAVFCARAGVILAHDFLAPAPAEPVLLSSASCNERRARRSRRRRRARGLALGNLPLQRAGRGASDAAAPLGADIRRRGVLDRQGIRQPTHARRDRRRRPARTLVLHVSAHRGVQGRARVFAPRDRAPALRRHPTPALRQRRRRRRRGAARAGRLPRSGGVRQARRLRSAHPALERSGGGAADPGRPAGRLRPRRPRSTVVDRHRGVRRRDRARQRRSRGSEPARPAGGHLLRARFAAVRDRPRRRPRARTS
ncbi:FG-GAP repeat domain-containing protein [Nannocystis pusilla]|uniref:FG-GAP repeat domain-containing protein n=1 Tax=Nannocystis pusilla TaxID=889268 RepID=UPI003DA44934